jgi:hypothetical protein
MFLPTDVCSQLQNANEFAALLNFIIIMTLFEVLVFYYLSKTKKSSWKADGPTHKYAVLYSTVQYSTVQYTVHTYAQTRSHPPESTATANRYPTTTKFLKKVRRIDLIAASWEWVVRKGWIRIRSRNHSSFIATTDSSCRFVLLYNTVHHASCCSVWMAILPMHREKQQME